MIYPSWIKKIVDKAKYYSTSHYDLVEADQQQYHGGHTAGQHGTTTQEEVELSKSSQRTSSWSSLTSFQRNTSHGKLSTSNSRGGGLASLASSEALSVLGLRNRNNSSNVNAAAHSSVMDDTRSVGSSVSAASGGIFLDQY
jgi:hypothetical protein